MTVIALIPARSGSRRLPHKNIKMLGAHPLVAYTIQAASDGLERTYSFRRVGSHPLVVLVGLASDDYLAQWRRDARKTWLLSGWFCVLTTLLGGLLLRAWSRASKK